MKQAQRKHDRAQYRTGKLPHWNRILRSIGLNKGSGTKNKAQKSLKFAVLNGVTQRREFANTSDDGNDSSGNDVGLFSSGGIGKQRRTVQFKLQNQASKGELVSRFNSNSTGLETTGGLFSRQLTNWDAFRYLTERR